MYVRKKNIYSYISLLYYYCYCNYYTTGSVLATSYVYFRISLLHLYTQKLAAQSNISYFTIYRATLLED